MASFAFKAVTVVLTLSFTAYSIIGCNASSEAMKQLEKYEDQDYTDIMVVYGLPDDVYRASVKALQEKEFVVTLSDPHTGLINAEKQNASVIPEDQKAMDDAKDSPSVGTIIVGVLAIIFVVGLIAILVGSCNDKDSKKDVSSGTSEEQKSSTTYVAPPPTPTVTSYGYIVSLTLTPIGTDSTEIDISATKKVLRNGAVESSVPMHSKYLNYSIFDAIYDRLQERH